MEDALVLQEHVQGGTEYHSLNPCCNGRCTRTTETKVIFVSLFRS